MHYLPLFLMAFLANQSLLSRFFVAPPPLQVQSLSNISQRSILLCGFQSKIYSFCVGFIFVSLWRGCHFCLSLWGCHFCPNRNVIDMLNDTLYFSYFFWVGASSPSAWILLLDAFWPAFLVWGFKQAFHWKAWCPWILFGKKDTLMLFWCCVKWGGNGSIEKRTLLIMQHTWEITCYVWLGSQLKIEVASFQESGVGLTIATYVNWRNTVWSDFKISLS